MSVIQISVSYTLSEYLSFVRDHLPTILGRAKGHRTAPVLSPKMGWLVKAAASLSFAIKKLRMPVCEFVIDEQRILRRTSIGELIVPWSDVIEVHRYSQGFLIEKARGAMPLPYRALSTDQTARFEAILAQVFSGERLKRRSDSDTLSPDERH